MFGVFPLSPAYSRDYNSQKEVEIDWNAGKDFQCVNGQYCSKRDFSPGARIEVRYHQLRRVHIFVNKV